MPPTSTPSVTSSRKKQESDHCGNTQSKWGMLEGKWGMLEGKWSTGMLRIYGCSAIVHALLMYIC